MDREIPIAIGGVGGSGTRLVAQLLIESGFYMGSDLNGAYDNLWFALLFNRRKVFTDTEGDFERLVEFFFRRMRGPCFFSSEEKRKILELGNERRHQHGKDFLQKRAETFLTQRGNADRRRWGWKLPPTHVLIEKLLGRDQRLHYVHVTRNGLDMAYSANQNQLGTWGPIFLDRDVEIGPRDALTFWCVVHRRMQSIAKEFSGRVHEVRFEDICDAPRRAARDILDFCHQNGSEEAVHAFAENITPPPSMGRFRSKDLSDLNPQDIRYVEEAGFSID